MGHKILIVGTSAEEVWDWSSVIERTGAQIVKAFNKDEVFAVSESHDFALSVVDDSTSHTLARETAEMLRSQERTRSLPILFLSHRYSNDFHRFCGCDAGPVDFMSKSCHPDLFLSKVNVFLQLARQKRELLGQTELRDSKCYFESILMSIGDPVIIVSPEGVIKDVNQRTLALLGYEEKELLGVPVRKFFEPEGNTVHSLSDFRLQGHSQMQDFQNIEVVLKTRDEGRIPALLSGSIFRDKQANTLGTVLLVRDISERKLMEERLNAYMLRLEQSNRQLQEFAAVASHDLQEPLRKIKAFGELLISKHRKDLNNEAVDFLERMRNAAERMQILMESLLSYSRVTTKAEPFTCVDLNQVLRNVQVDLEWRIKQTGAEVKVKDLVAIEAEPNQMHQLFQNLVGNALKFHGEQKPIVKVYTRPYLAHSKNARRAESRFCRICVEDNGIGFDEKYLDRLFAPFQRLHGRNEYEGTGMGLAICHRIVERHGGSIKAWSTPGKGATFMVTLPLRQSEEPIAQPVVGSQLSLYGDTNVGGQQEVVSCKP